MGRIRDTINMGKAYAVMLATGKSISRQAAEYLYKRTKYRCPVLTGHMESTISIETDPTGAVSTVTVGAPYSVYVHAGHYTKNGVFIPPNPFMQLAFEDTAAFFPSIVSKSEGFQHGKTVSQAASPDLTGPRIHTVATQERMNILVESGELNVSGPPQGLGINLFE